MSPRRKPFTNATVQPMSNRKQTTDLRAAIAGELENKDLSATVAEPAAPAEDDEDSEEEPTVAVVKVEMVHHYTYGDANLLPGQTVDLPIHIARPLIAGHFAKLA